MESKDKQHHAVCMPVPSQGHINGMLKLAKILHSKGFFITFVNSEFNHSRILKSRGPSALDGLPDFRFATMPDGLIPSDDLDKSRDTVSLSTSFPSIFSLHFPRLLDALNDPSSGVPPVSCVISDCFTSFTLAATEELAIPNVFFCSSSACGFLAFFRLKELKEKGMIPLRTGVDPETIIDWIPGSLKMRLKDMPNMLAIDRNDSILNLSIEEVQASPRAAAIIVNTFGELERPVIDAMSSFLPPIYDVGPLSMLSQHIDSSLASIELNLWSEDSSCLEWLEGKEPGSVLYVNFGSMAVLTNQQLVEFAWGLANSGFEFLWVIRPDLFVGENAVLPEEFSVETRGRSFLTSWCPQEKVLAHEAVGAFLTHSGWNSTTESICAGVPMLCWAFFGDQQTNCRYICSEWGFGLEIHEDVKRERLEMLIKEVMEGQKGKEMRRKVLEWKEKAENAVKKPDGSSWRNLEKVIEEIIKK